MQFELTTLLISSSIIIYCFLSLMVIAQTIHYGRSQI